MSVPGIYGYLGVLAVACLPYLPALLFAPEKQFQSDWDDRVNFIENEHIQNWSWSSLEWMWLDGILIGVYEPMSLMFKSGVVRLFGLSAQFFFGLSILLHGLNAVLLADVSFALIHSRHYSGKEADTGTQMQRLRLSCCIVSILFAVHPLRVEVVGWLSCQSYLLATASSLLCIRFMVAHHQRSATLGCGYYTFSFSWWKLAAAASFCTALLCKTVVIPLTGVLVLIDVLFFDRRGLWRKRRTNSPAMVLAASIIDHLPFILVSMYGVRTAVLANTRGMQPTAEEGAGIRRLIRTPSYRNHLTGAETVFKAAFGTAWYLIHTHWPGNLSIFYPVHVDFDAFAPSFAGPAVLVLVGTSILIACLLAVAHGKQAMAPAASMLRVCAATWGSYICILLPTLGFVQHGWPIYVADRYSYISLMVFVPPCACAFRRLLESRANGRKTFILVALLVLAMAAQSAVAVEKWSSSHALWTHAVVYRPSDAIAHYNMGCVSEKQRDYSTAIVMFQKALSHDPDYGAAHNNLGFLLEETRGMFEQAEHHYREAIRLNPGHYTAHNNLGKLMHRRNQAADAEAHYKEAIKLQPQYGKALYNLATLLHTSSARHGEAEELYRAAISVAPTKPEPYYNLAVLLGSNDPDNLTIVGLLESALKANPKYQLAQQALTFMKRKQGQ